jgi:uncharacterized membrane protein
MAVPIDPHRALLRTVIALLAGVVTAVGAWSHPPAPTFAVLLGWNATAAVLLALSWVPIASADAAATQRRAGSEDPGRTLVYVIVVVASAASMFAAVSLSGRARRIAPEEAGPVIGLCLATVALAWGLTHTAFTLRYARLYYREDKEGIGGVEFPGKHHPSYFDFAYFAFTIGMCFQVSDTCITSSQIRRAALLHALIAFAYNTALLAFVLNLVFGALTGP